jgi:hypothetical protein
MLPDLRPDPTPALDARTRAYRRGWRHQGADRRRRSDPTFEGFSVTGEERSNEETRAAIEALRQDDDVMGTSNAPIVQEMVETLERITGERDSLRAENERVGQWIDGYKREQEGIIGAALARIEAVNDEATYDDVYSEISLALGTDDSADEDVDFKRDLTERILRHFHAALASPAATPEPTVKGVRVPLSVFSSPIVITDDGHFRVAATPEPTEETQR